MSDSDRIRLQHMLEAAREAVSFIEGASRDDLARDRKLALALVKEIEIVGEAATKISADLKQAIPSVPWAKIAGMRNRLIHGYADIDFDILWDTAVYALGPLIQELERRLGKEGR